MVHPCFAGIGKIEYKPDAPPGEVLCFRHYNAQQVSKCVLVSLGRPSFPARRVCLSKLVCSNINESLSLSSGGEGSYDGGVAEVFRLFLAHLPWHRSALRNFSLFLSVLN